MFAEAERLGLDHPRVESHRERGLGHNARVALDPLWIGVVGAGIGAFAGGLPTVWTAVVNAVSARGQRQHDAAEAKAQREADAAEAKAQREHENTLRRRQVAAQLLSERQVKIHSWRENLRYARNEHQSWQQGLMNIEGEPSPVHRQRLERPNVVGEEWFEELRGLLPEDSVYRDTTAVFCDLDTVTELSQEIGRLEREWTAEAQG